MRSQACLLLLHPFHVMYYVLSSTVQSNLFNSGSEAHTLSQYINTDTKNIIYRIYYVYLIFKACCQRPFSMFYILTLLCVCGAFSMVFTVCLYVTCNTECDCRHWFIKFNLFCLTCLSLIYPILQILLEDVSCKLWLVPKY